MNKVDRNAIAAMIAGNKNIGQGFINALADYFEHDSRSPCDCAIYDGETDPLPVPYKYVAPTFDREAWIASCKEE